MYTVASPDPNPRGGGQLPNSSMEIIFILSGRYKIFTFCLFCVCKSYSTFKNQMVHLLHGSMVEVFF